MNQLLVVCQEPPVSKAKQEPETFLEDDNIILIKRMFSDEDKYKHYMTALWLLRDLLARNIDTCDQLNAIKHPQFPLFDLINSLIGALLREDVRFKTNAEGVHYFRYK
jgi:hypothetical protein